MKSEKRKTKRRSRAKLESAAKKQARRIERVACAAARAIPAARDRHPAEQYAADVVSGKIVTGKWVKLAVRRHLRDLETADGRGLRFNRARAERVIRFFGFLKHTKGEWAGQTVILGPWQQFHLWCIFGWERKNEKDEWVRRFRMSYIKVARKNGKSTEAAGVGLYLFMADGEPGAEVYTAATKREQARIVHGEAVAMVKKSPALSKRVQVYKDNLNVPATRSKFEPLGSDEDTTDGFNPHGAVIDELHAHKTRGMLDVLDSATGARRQPLIFIITTAGLQDLGPDTDMQAYAEKILEGVLEDDSFFAIVYAIDEADDWRDEACWIKANPNLRVTVKIDDLKAKACKALAMPTARNEFLCKHMDRAVKQVVCWMPMEQWNACAEFTSDAALAGRRCFAGVDLSSKLDVAALALVFPPDDADPKWRVKVTLFVPEATALVREREARVPYHTWGQEHHLQLTPGNVIDYDFIKAEIAAAAKRHDLVELGFDPWNATQIALQLQEEGLTCVEVNQGFRSLSEPTKELEKLVASEQFRHDGNPALDWMASNVAVVADPAGNIKPSKKDSKEKIDGVAAIVTAMARALVAAGGASVYDDDDKELLVL